MSPLELTSFITFLANAIACQVTDSNQLALLSTIFTQLGDTLATILAQKALCDDQNSSNETIKK